MRFTRRVLFHGAVAIALLCGISVFARMPNSIRLNEEGFSFARQLISDGHMIAAGKGGWSKDRPSASDENEFIRRHGFAEYAKWHLGIDERHGKDTKARYKFPYGDFKDVHRCGLIAAKARAQQYGYTEIQNAAARLIDVITQKNE